MKNSKVKYEILLPVLIQVCFAKSWSTAKDNLFSEGTDNGQSYLGRVSVFPDHIITEKRKIVWNESR